jgi:hypothetical protein
MDRAIQDKMQMKMQLEEKRSKVEMLTEENQNIKFKF